jgi:hypothetical protein
MVHVGPALALFAIVAAALAVVTYLYMESENRYIAAWRKNERKLFLAEEYRWLKEDLGVDPDGVLDNEAEYFAIYEAIENSSDRSDEDRRDLITLLEKDYEAGMISDTR